MAKLNTQMLQENIPQYEKLLNKDAIAIVDALAAKVKASGDDNTVTQQFIQNCVKVQDAFNVLTDSARKAEDVMKNVAEISEYFDKRATVTEVSQKDTSFQSQAVDASAVMRG